MYDDEVGTKKAETPVAPIPTIGRIVHYKLTEVDVEQIRRRRTNSQSIEKRIESGQWPEGAQAHIGNDPTIGEIVPAIVTRVFPHCFGENIHGVNLQCTLDGCDSIWVTSRKFGDLVGEWSWPPRV